MRASRRITFADRRILWDPVDAPNVHARTVYLACMGTFGLAALALATPGLLTGPEVADVILWMVGLAILAITAWATARLRRGSLPEAAVPAEFGPHLYAIVAATALFVAGTAWRLLG